MSSTPTQTSLYSSTHFFTPSVSYSPSATSSQSPSVSFTLTLIPSQSISFSHDLTQTPSSSFSVLPSPSSTQKCILISAPTTTLGSISDNTFYVIIFTIVALFFINTSYSIHYYNAYTNEKTRRRVINDQVQMNPYHTNVRDTFNRV